MPNATSSDFAAAIDPKTNASPDSNPRESMSPLRLGFTGSILAGGARIIDSIWDGAAKFVIAFKDLDQGRAMTAVLAVAMMLGAIGATIAIGVMGYSMTRATAENSNNAGSEATAAALIKLMNEQDDKRAVERDRDQERLLRQEEKRISEREKDREQVARLTAKIDRVGTSNEKIARALETLTGKFPNMAAPYPRPKDNPDSGETGREDRDTRNSPSAKNPD